MIAPQPPKTQIRFVKVFDFLASILFIVGILAVLIRLGSMNLEGVAPVAMASIALGIAYTSLLYGRARAVEDGPSRRRTLVAAERAFRGVVVHRIALVVGTLIYNYLLRHGYMPRIPDLNSAHFVFGLETTPVLWAMFVILILSASANSYYLSLKTLTRRGFMGDAMPSAFSRHKNYYSSLARRALEDHRRKT